MFSGFPGPARSSRIPTRPVFQAEGLGSRWDFASQYRVIGFAGYPWSAPPQSQGQVSGSIIHVEDITIDHTTRKTPVRNKTIMPHLEDRVWKISYTSTGTDHPTWVSCTGHHHRNGDMAFSHALTHADAPLRCTALGEIRFHLDAARIQLPSRRSRRVCSPS